MMYKCKIVDKESPFTILATYFYCNFRYEKAIKCFKERYPNWKLLEMYCVNNKEMIYQKELYAVLTKKDFINKLIKMGCKQDLENPIYDKKTLIAKYERWEAREEATQLEKERKEDLEFNYETNRERENREHKNHRRLRN